MSIFSKILSKFHKTDTSETEEVESSCNDMPTDKNTVEIHDVYFEYKIAKDSQNIDSLYAYIGSQRYLAELPIVIEPEGDICVLYPCLSRDGSYRVQAVDINFFTKNMKLACNCFAKFITEGIDFTNEYLCRACDYAIQQHIAEHGRIIDSDLMAISYAYISVCEAIHNHSHMDDYKLNIHGFQKNMLDVAKFYHKTKLFITVFNGPFAPSLRPYSALLDD